MGGEVCGNNGNAVSYREPHKRIRGKNGNAALVRCTMPTLLLIRHARPIVTPGTPPSTWPLAPEGQRAARTLAHLVAPYAPNRVITSEEVKARETGGILAATLSLPSATEPDLREHERGPGDYFDSEEAFTRTVADFFARPDALVFGRETATAARERFLGALAAQVAAHPGETLALVTHGTVLSLAVAAWRGLDARDIFAFWRGLPMPALVVVEVAAEDLARGRVVATIDPSASDEEEEVHGSSNTIR